jgi:hypothetical protein
MAAVVCPVIMAGGTRMLLMLLRPGVFGGRELRRTSGRDRSLTEKEPETSVAAAHSFQWT